MVVLGIVADLHFRAAELGDVADAADHHPPSVGEPDAALARDDGAKVAFAVGEEFLVLVLDAGLEHHPILGDEDVGLLLRQEVVVGAPDQVVVRPAHQLRTWLR